MEINTQFKDTPDGLQTVNYLSHSIEDLKNPIAFIGCPGIADIGKFALDSIIGQLKAINYMDIIFDEYPAGAIVDDSLLAVPKAEVLIWKDPKKIRDVVLITADAQSLTPKGIYKISSFVTSILNKMGISLIIALGAYPVSSQKLTSKIPQIYATSTNREFLEKFLKKNKCEKISKGVIIGANGLIPCLAKARYNIDGLVLLAETDNIAMVNEDITDLKASIALLDMIKKTFMLPIKKKYSFDNLDDITKNLKDKKDKLEKDLDSFSFIDTEEKRKSLYI